MALAQEDIAFIKQHIGEWLAEQSLDRPPAAYKLEPRERMARVEEELERQHELMLEGCAQMEKRLEQMDKRFATMQASTDERFDRMKFFALAFAIAIATGSGVIVAGMRWP